MAEELGQSRTEAPTQRRREEAREQGRLAFSAELTGGLLLLAGVGALWLGARALAGGLLDTLRLDLLGIGRITLGPEQVQALLAGLFGRAVELIGYFLGILFVVGLAAGTMQAGFQVTPEVLGLHWDRLSPVAGWSRIVSLAGLMRGVVSLLKVGVVALLASWVLKGRGAQIAAAGSATLGQGVAQGWDIALRLALAIAAAMVLIGLVDYLFQRWRHEQSLLMTRQELKEEVKRDEGDPQMKARIRKLQREMSRRRMMEDVPRATVVVTNPTHLAVALRYERGRMAAPKVVAKGAGFIAQNIVALARRHAVPVIERRPVARALYQAVRVGQEIPAALYLAVAEVLAYLYRLRGQPQ